MSQAKAAVEKILGRVVGVEVTKRGKFICKFVDYNAPMSTLVADTEDLAYELLLGYLQSRETHNELRAGTAPADPT